MNTDRDISVLNAILNPNFHGMALQGLANPNNKTEDSSISSLPGFNECKKLEVEGVQLAESDCFDQSLIKFSEAIISCPNNPSPYNNRAQLYRLMQKIPEALADLDKAIQLSNGVGSAAAQAYVQRAIIHKLNGEDDLAKEKYSIASDLGSTFAKQQLVAMNPYAALCSNMLAEVMSKFKSFGE